MNNANKIIHQIALINKNMTVKKIALNTGKKPSKIEKNEEEELSQIKWKIN